MSQSVGWLFPYAAFWGGFLCISDALDLPCQMDASEVRGGNFAKKCVFLGGSRFWINKNYDFLNLFKSPADSI
jgi:hypothetical protein